MQTFFAGGGEAEVFLVFDTTMADPLGDLSAADPGKWTCRIGDVAYAGALLDPQAYNVLRVYFLEVGADAGADEVRYANAPSDVSDAGGRMLAAFVRGL